MFDGTMKLLHKHSTDKLFLVLFFLIFDWSKVSKIQYVTRFLKGC